MLATLATPRFVDAGWFYELKLDGVRALTHRDGDHVRMFSRNEKPMERRYPEVVDALRSLAVSRFVVDDAIVVLENINRHVEAGKTPMAAAYAGAREVGFTLLSMNLSLVAARLERKLGGEHRG